MQSGEFDFGSDAVASSYDTVLVPLIFEPWAEALLDEHAGWEGLTVLDLATGTGVVAQLVADRVGPTGRVLGTDLNPEMLTQARAARQRGLVSNFHNLQIIGSMKRTSR